MKYTNKITLENLSDSVEKLISNMSLKEKISIMSATNTVEDFMGGQIAKNAGDLNAEELMNGYCDIPYPTGKVTEIDFVPVKFTDGPRGIVSGNCTAFPVSMSRGASFDMDLERRIGMVIGYEARARGANYFGGVCMNILRHPAGGRAQETYSEDMFHLGRMAGQLVEGVQYHNVIACIKHFAVNNIENTRLFVNVELDDRTFHEVYLPHFKYCIQQKNAASVMGAYNKIRKEQCCESKLLLTDTLRDDWGFEGFTPSDFMMGVRDAARAVNAGMDVEMPVKMHYIVNLEKDVADGIVNESTIDESVRRILKTSLRFALSQDPCESYDSKNISCDEHVKLAKEAADKGTVLLRNENGILPLDKASIRKIALIGDLADSDITGDHGSSWVHSPYITTIKDGIEKELEGSNIELLTAFDNNDIKSAQDAAKDADIAIIVVGSTFSDEGEHLGGSNDLSSGMAGENFNDIDVSAFSLGLSETRGGDRKRIRLKDNEIKLVNEVSRVNKQVVLITFAGAAIIYEDVIDNTKAILMGWFAGMEGGNAISDILFGKVNPSAKTPCIFAKDEVHYPELGSGPPEVFYEYYHGYMKLEKENIEPRYPFGYGLSYTTYKYSNQQAKVTGDKISASFNISNTGQYDGEEIVQVYVGAACSKVDRPIKTLQGFKRIPVQKGKSVSDTIEVNITDRKYYDDKAAAWVLEPGKYNVYIGSSSDNKDLVCISVDI